MRFPSPNGQLISEFDDGGSNTSKSIQATSALFCSLKTGTGQKRRFFAPFLLEIGGNNPFPPAFFPTKVSIGHILKHARPVIGIKVSRHLFDGPIVGNAGVKQFSTDLRRT